MAKDTTAKENINMDDFESLLATLSAEDLENINDLVDPEVSQEILRLNMHINRYFSECLFTRQ